MRRIAAILCIVAAAIGVGLTTSATGDDTRTYYIELDNAFDLTKGGDFKIAGVAAGSIERLHVDPKRLTAIADVSLESRGAPRLRADATCSSRPQSLRGGDVIELGTSRAILELE